LRFSTCFISTPNVTIPGTWTASSAKRCHSLTHFSIVSGAPVLPAMTGGLLFSYQRCGQLLR
jgi:hypothetical protein